MSDSCPTVRIANDKAPGGYVVINEEDFDSETQEIYEEPSEAEPTKAEPKTHARKR